MTTAGCIVGCLYFAVNWPPACMHGGTEIDISDEGQCNTAPRTEDPESRSKKASYMKFEIKYAGLLEGVDWL